MSLKYLATRHKGIEVDVHADSEMTTLLIPDYVVEELGNNIMAQAVDDAMFVQALMRLDDDHLTRLADIFSNALDERFKESEEDD